MKLLLHICCAPCAIFPLRLLDEAGHKVMGYFHTANIHPYSECLRRQEALVKYARRIDLKLIIAEKYDLEGFLQSVVHREKHRCRICYHHRLRTTALLARRGKFDAFSTTLLYSKFQKHKTIRSIGEAVAEEVGITFLYHDFRQGWKEGVERSRQMGIYRQDYCGCIYSEKERFGG